MNALAPGGVVVARAKTRMTAVSSPSVLVCKSGRLLISYDEYWIDRSELRPGETIVMASDDCGASWRAVGRINIMQARLFYIKDIIYCIGHNGNVGIAKSETDGDTWSETCALTANQSWHQSSANVIEANGNVYLVMERITAAYPDTWYVCWLAPVVFRAALTSDLMRRDSWQLASELTAFESLPGLKQNQPPGEFFGIPFFAQNAPFRNHLGYGRYMHPLGWLEGNIVQIHDERHYWYDPNGKTFHLLLRCNTGSTGFAGLLKVLEHSDGRMSTCFETTPSGRRIAFLPLPGGHIKFFVLYDVVTHLYWLLSSQPTDSMVRIECLPKSVYNLANNERNRLVLHFSKNIVDWCFAGIVDNIALEYGTRNYGAMTIDGEDLLIASRSADGSDQTLRDTPLITFHRVNRFRDLVY
jgi:hypothetical protein